MRYLGIDFGTKKVGIALSDEAGTMGFPKDVLTNDERLIDEVVARIAHEGVEAVVIGESRNYSGEENEIAREARVFAEELEARTHVPVYWESEMLTTQAARRDPEGERTNHGIVDASAAALILTSYLSHINPTEDNPED